jgi:hypothetical protein
MPTNRKRTPRSRKVLALNPGEINFLYDRDDPLGNPWMGRHFMTKEEIKALWVHNRDEVLKWWADNHPCTRPGPWWEYDAPKELVHGCDGTEFFAYQTYRLRLGGIGTPAHEVLAYVPASTLGIPDSWVERWSVDYYNGRAVDIHGERIGTEYKEGHFKVVAIDPDDPPAYESQAAYLQRHGLLTAEEKQYLKKHRELMEPEVIEFDLAG